MATRAKPRVPFTVEDLLLRGWPGEILPAELPRVREQARAYATNANHPESARARVLSVWIEGDYQAAWDGSQEPQTEEDR